jgi:hypothetical protein
LIAFFQIEPQHVLVVPKSNDKRQKQGHKSNATKKSTDTHTEEDTPLRDELITEHYKESKHKHSRNRANIVGKGHPSTRHKDKGTGEFPPVNVRLPKKSQHGRTSEDFEALDSWRSTLKPELTQESQPTTKSKALLSDLTKKKILNIIGEEHVVTPKHKDAKHDEAIHTSGKQFEKANHHHSAGKDSVSKRALTTKPHSKSDRKSEDMKQHHKHEVAEKSIVSSAKKSSQGKATDKSKGGFESDDWRVSK